MTRKKYFVKCSTGFGDRPQLETLDGTRLCEITAPNAEQVALDHARILNAHSELVAALKAARRRLVHGLRDKLAIEIERGNASKREAKLIERYMIEDDEYIARIDGALKLAKGGTK
jgi:hypothetical protein